MHLLMGLMALLLISCAHDIERNIASTPDIIVLGQLDLQHTTIRHFLPETSEHKNEHLFYITARDINNQPIDLDPSEFGVSVNRKKLKHTIERVALGRYMLSFHSEGLGTTVFTLQGKKLNLLLEKKKQLPDLQFSRARIISNERHVLVLEVILNDKNNKPVALLDLPEILTIEDLVIREIKMVKTGVWHVTISYPDQNFLMYISVRANGVFFPKLFRYQHIEK